MEILVAILTIALIAAIAFAVIQRRPAGARGPGLGRRRSSPIDRRGRGVPRNDPMAAAVAEHARAIDPQDVVVAENRLREQARQVAAGLHAEADRSEHQRAADQVAHGRPPDTDQVAHGRPPDTDHIAHDGPPDTDRVSPRREDRRR